MAITGHATFPDSDRLEALVSGLAPSWRGHDLKREIIQLGVEDRPGPAHLGDRGCTLQMPCYSECPAKPAALQLLGSDVAAGNLAQSPFQGPYPAHLAQTTFSECFALIWSDRVNSADSVGLLSQLFLPFHEDRTVRQSHDIATEARFAIRGGLDWVADVLVHVEPSPRVARERTESRSVEVVSGERTNSPAKSCWPLNEK